MISWTAFSRIRVSVSNHSILQSVDQEEMLEVDIQGYQLLDAGYDCSLVDILMVYTLPDFINSLNLNLSYLRQLELMLLNKCHE